MFQPYARQRIGRGLFAPDPLLGQRTGGFLGLGTHLGGPLLVEREPQIDLRAEGDALLLSGALDVDARVFLVEQVDALVEVDPPDVEAQLPQPALGLGERIARNVGRYDRAAAAFDSHVERNPRPCFGLHAARGEHLLPVAVFGQHVVGGHVGAVDQTVDPEPGDFEHVLGLPERAARHVGYGHHLLPEGVDREVDRASGLDLDAPFGKLVEHDAAFVGRDEERVVDGEHEVAVVRLPLRFGQRHAREVGHGAAGAVARAGEHQHVGRDGQRDERERDEREVAGQRPAAECVPVSDGFLHGGCRVISGPCGRGRRRSADR